MLSYVILLIIKQNLLFKIWKIQTQTKTKTILNKIVLLNVKKISNE